MRSHVGSTHILLIAVDAIRRAAERALLESAGYTVIAVSDERAADGAGLASDGVFDCIVLDSEGNRCAESCRLVRSLPWARGLPLVAVCEASNAGTGEALLRAGADGLVFTPLVAVELLMRIESVICQCGDSSSASNRAAVCEASRRLHEALLRRQLHSEQLLALTLHDLISPLNSIDLNAQLLLMRELDPAPESRRLPVEYVRADVRSVLRLIQVVTELQRAEQGRLSVHLEDVALAGVAADAKASLEAYSRAKTIDVCLRVGDYLAQADPRLLRGVLENLLQQAIWNAPAGSQVLVESEVVAGRVRTWVRDSGPQIAPEDRDRIFDRFFQVDHAYDSRTTVALALPYCWMAVHAQGGSIELDLVGRVSFGVSLPCSASRRVAEGSSA